MVPRGNESLSRLTEILKSGDVAIMACDTIYGFVGAVPESEERIREIKGRAETKPFLQLIPGPGILDDLGFEMPPAGFLDLWPGPFTYVLKGSGGNTVAFRVPEDEYLRRLIHLVGRPLFSTSVNRAGSPPMDDPKEMDSEFGSEVPIIEDAGFFTGNEPSTVVNLTVRPCTILRQGAGRVPPELLN